MISDDENRLSGEGGGGKAKKRPEVKPWVRRVVEAAGVEVGEGEKGDTMMGWWGVEMARFLGFARGLPEGASLLAAMEGYGRFLNSHEPKLEEWRIDQARVARNLLIARNLLLA